MLGTKVTEAVEKYQCPGCVNGSDFSCYSQSSSGVGCGKHAAGTRLMPYVGLIWLGMPKGFCRLGEMGNDLKIEMFESLSVLTKLYSKVPVIDESLKKNYYNMFNVAVWKHKTKEGHILVRGLQPRINRPFVHILLSDEGYDQINCQEITEQLTKEMD